MPMIYINKKINAQKGQSLIEVLFGMVIFVIISSAVLFLLTGNYRSISQDKEINTAYSIAREGIEAVKSIGKQGWFNIGCYAEGVGLKLQNSYWQLAPDYTEPIIEDKFQRIVKIFPLFRDANQQISESIENNTFDPYIKKVESTVSWPINNSVTYASYLSSWATNEFIWTNDSDFSNTADRDNIKIENGSFRLKKRYMSNADSPANYLQYATSGIMISPVYDTISTSTLASIWWDYAFVWQWDGVYSAD